MKTSQAEYSIEHTGRRMVVKGILRLATPGAYDALFAPIADQIARPDGIVTLDLRDVTFMNSSGIRALANLIIAARAASTELRLTGTNAIPWQKKTMASLAVLYDGLTVDLTD